MTKAKLFVVLCTLALGCLLATQAEAAKGQLTEQERYVLKQVAAGKSADLLERFVLPRMAQERRWLARERGLAGYLDLLEALCPKEKEEFLKRYEKHLRIGAPFLEDLLTGALKVGNLKVKVHRKGIQIINAVIAKPLDLKSAEVPCEVRLDYCVFWDNVIFEDSQFDKNLSLRYCYFHGKANFSKMIVKKSAYFRETRFKETVNISSAKIGISLNMESTNFCSWAIFHSITIKENAYFGENATFGGPLNFRRAKVGGLLDFGSVDEGATFKKGLDFSDLKVGSHLALRGALIFGPAEFTGADIKGDFKAKKTWFLGPHYPPNPKKNYAAIFPDMKVGRVANLEETVFLGLVNLSRVDVSLELRTHKARFINPKKALDAIGLKVGTIAYFKDAVFQGTVNFSGADIGGQFNAIRAKFESNLPAVFSGMKVGELAEFTNAEFNGKVLFSRSEVGGKLITKVEKEIKEGTIIKGAVFDGEVSFDDAHLIDLELQGTDKKRLNISRLNLKRLCVDKDFSLEYATVDKLKAENLRVDGQASFKNVKITQKADLRYSHFGILRLERNDEGRSPSEPEHGKKDEGESPKRSELVGLEEKTKLILDGMVYKGLCPIDQSHREKWIELLNHSRFDAGNYKQLENYFANLGYESEADEVYIAMKNEELAHTAWYNPGRWLIKIFWGLLVGYGRKPWRVLVVILPLITLGTILFTPKFDEKFLTSNSWLQGISEKHPWIIKFLLSLDRFLPAVDLGLAKKWAPVKVSIFTFSYWHFLKLTGWITIPIALAAIYTRIK